MAHLSDEELQSLPRGGHDYRKLYAAYKAATEHVGAPTAILAKTIKGWTLGPEIEARNATHQIKKMTKAQLLTLRNRLFLHDEIPEHDLDADLPPYYRPAPDEKAARSTWPSAARPWAARCPAGWCGRSPSRLRTETAFADLLAGSGRQAVSTTMAFARLLRSLVRDPSIGERIVPIVSDEARTFGLESLISEVQIYAPEGQRYTPVDAGLALHYAESATGQVLQEGISEAGAVAAFTAAATSYATWGEPMIPFYLFYSMFGFQRVGDLLWALGDCRGRGFLLGCTAGRTTLNGEGLQHQDGHSLLLASTVPSVAAYDPAFSYEVADHRRGRDPADDRARARGPGLVPDAVQRELPDAGAARRPGRGRAGPARAPSRASTGSRPRRRREAPARSGGWREPPGPGHHALLGLGVAGGRRGPAAAGCRLGRGRRPVVGDLVQVAAGGRHLRRAVEPAPSRGARAGARSSPSSWPVPAGPDRGGDRLHALGPRPGLALDAPARSPRSAPTASAAPTPGRSCAGSSRWTPPTSWWPSSTVWPPRRRPARHGGRGHRALRHRPGRRRPLVELTRRLAGCGGPRPPIGSRRPAHHAVREPDPATTLALRSPNSARIWPTLIDQMLAAMHATEFGVGLSANQVGRSDRVFIFDFHDGMAGHVVNPAVHVLGNELQRDDEACLSLPGLGLATTRPSRCVVRGVDRSGEAWMTRGRAWWHDASSTSSITSTGSSTSICIRWPCACASAAKPRSWTGPGSLGSTPDPKGTGALPNPERLGVGRRGGGCRSVGHSAAPSPVPPQRPTGFPILGVRAIPIVAPDRDSRIWTPAALSSTILSMLTSWSTR